MLEKTRTLGRAGLAVSPLGLGTTEIGYDYGIGPRDLPSEEDAFKLLERVLELGINFIDTAHFYGVAEERIGKSGVAKREGIIIATKCGHILDRGLPVTADELEKQIRSEVEESRRKLDLVTLPLVLLHGGSAEQIKSGLLTEIMQKLKGEKKVRYVGISTRGDAAPLAAIETGFFDVLQLGHSILDQRMIAKVMPAAKEKDIGIINRSVLLKGVLTPARQYLTDELKPLKDNADEAEKIALEIGTDLPGLSLRFALSNPHIDVALVGSNKIAHIEKAVEAASAGPLTEDVLAKLRALAIADPKYVDPKQWPVDSVVDSVGGVKVHGK